MSTTWQTFGHEGVKEILDKALANGRLAHAYLFAGPSGVGKRTLAEEFAKKILGAGSLVNHPDFLPLDEPGEIKVERLREFTARVALRPLLGQNKVALINNAERLNAESANALLKTLEEAPPSTVIILVGRQQGLLPTVLSRCQILGFGALSEPQLREFAQTLPARVTNEMLGLCFGCPGELVRLAAEQPWLESRLQAVSTWRELKGQASAQRLLRVTELAELENFQLYELFGLWLDWELRQLRQQPKSFSVLEALRQAMVGIGQNRNKKSLLQSLFMSF
ncbi:MAG: hypothetical protein KGJ93_00800 [Patescibacteria group bacterium]|nr:hypothetical protein [Patescibacteria group bacterium]